MKEKIKKLKVYAEQLSNRISAPLPAKHVGREKSYKDFLQHELNVVTKQLEALQLGFKETK